MDNIPQTPSAPVVSDTTVSIADVEPTLVPPTETAVPPTISPTIVPTVPNEDLSISAEQINFYPAGQLQQGDSVTIQIFPYVPENIPIEQVNVRIVIDDELMFDGGLRRGNNLGAKPSGLYQWVWVIGQADKEYTIDITVDPFNTIELGDENPDNNTVSIPIQAVARDEVAYSWQTAETEFAVVSYVSDTAAERDLELLKQRIDIAIEQAAELLDVEVDEKVDIYFIDRIIGQGGYAGSSLVISYPHRNYIGNGLDTVLLHEMIHVLDNRYYRNSSTNAFLVEGFAVWGSGGHYKSEDLNQRAAALLLDTDYYIPLSQLVNEFYLAQHEVGYLQGGAFVSYLIDTYGWEKFKTLYTQLEEGNTPTDAFNYATTTIYGKTLNQLEQDWHTMLYSQPRTALDATDLELSIQHFELARRYQLAYDPTAHFLYAWLPSAETMKRKGITDSIVRHPESLLHITFELMFVSADEAIRAGKYDRAKSLHQSIERAIENEGQFLDPISSGYQEVAHETIEMGYTPKKIQFISGKQSLRATVIGQNEENKLIELKMKYTDNKWLLGK